MVVEIVYFNCILKNCTSFYILTISENKRSGMMVSCIRPIFYWIHLILALVAV